MKWSGERYKCRKCGEVYPYSLSTCNCGGICDRIADASVAHSDSSTSCPSLKDILAAEQQKLREGETHAFNEEIDRLNIEIKEACERNDYSAAVGYLKRILEINPNSPEANELLKICIMQLEKSIANNNNNRRSFILNGVEFTLCWCPAGSFSMGASYIEHECESDEVLHQVTLSKGFWMMETEVTQKQWNAVMRYNPSYYRGDNLPVEMVSWNDCQNFCNECSRLGVSLQLPTEAQWEYACRAGTTTPFFWGDALNGDKANCSGAYPYGTYKHGVSLSKTSPVKNYQPNSWGIYDMHGNVWEWCQDWYGPYQRWNVTDPVGSSSGYQKVCRGGSWRNKAVACRSANRNQNNSSYRQNNLGFRCVLNKQSQEI